METSKEKFNFEFADAKNITICDDFIVVETCHGFYNFPLGEDVKILLGMYAYKECSIF